MSVKESRDSLHRLWRHHDAAKAWVELAAHLVMLWVVTVS